MEALIQLRRIGANFKTLNTFLNMSSWTFEHGFLTISCSEFVAEKLFARVDSLRLKFDFVHTISINGDQLMGRSLTISHYQKSL
jgi:hypothetical protein